jgi:hypothetical protein
MKISDLVAKWFGRISRFEVWYFEGIGQVKPKGGWSERTDGFQCFRCDTRQEADDYAYEHRSYRAIFEVRQIDDYRDPFTGEALAQDVAVSRFLSDSELSNEGILIEQERVYAAVQSLEPFGPTTEGAQGGPK